MKRLVARRSLRGSILLLISGAGLALADEVRPCQVRVKGVPDRTLRWDMLRLSDTWEMRRHPPPTLTLLRRRAKQDAVTLRRLLRVRGYWAAEVEASVIPRRRRTHVVFRARTGPVYLLDNVEIRFVGDVAPPVRLPTAEELDLRPGQLAAARPILLAGREIVRLLGTRGYPGARLSDRQVIVDHAARKVRVLFEVDPGLPALFGPTEIRGLVHLRPSFVRRAVPWKEGEAYDTEKEELLRRRLVQAGLFSFIEIERADEPDSEGRLAVRVSLRERRRRTVELGAGYTTDRGAGGRATWLHRNLLGGAEQLRLSAEWLETETFSQADFRRPQFLRADQDLLLHLKGGREDTDAYRSRHLRALASVERALSESLKARAGVSVRLSELERDGAEDSFLLLSFPAQARWDTADDPFDPLSGETLTIQGAPTFELLAGEVGYFKAGLTGTRYLRLSPRPGLGGAWGRPGRNRGALTLAGRMTVGSLLGASLNDVPADERFYAGGGGSVRGYGYQTVGPLDDKGHPTGGRSLLESSVELRWRTGEKSGWAAFVDGGSVSEGERPEWDSTWRWGAGIGWRYFTEFGLIRADVAAPLNRRAGVDDRFQLYVSIGQAF